MQLGQALGWVAVIGGVLVVLFLASGPGEVTVDPETWGLIAKDVREVALEQCERYYDLVITWKLLTKSKQIPSDLFELEAPLKDGADPFTKIEPDPWGSQYYIEVDGEKFRVVSPGPDGVAGTEDDIAYPPCE